MDAELRALAEKMGWSSRTVQILSVEFIKNKGLETEFLAWCISVAQEEMGPVGELKKEDV